MDSEILRIPIMKCLDQDPINEKAGQSQPIIDLLATANRSTTIPADSSSLLSRPFTLYIIAGIGRIHLHPCFSLLITGASLFLYGYVG